MTIVIEDGTGKTDSNSYASEAELAAYATARGVTIAGTAAVLLIKAMDFIESQPFQGYKASEAQALQWPRYSVILYGYYLDGDEIPDLLKEAQMQAALTIDGGNELLADEGRATKREKVGEIEVEYMDGARNYTYPKAVFNKLSPLLKGGVSGSTKAIRA